MPSIAHVARSAACAAALFAAAGGCHPHVATSPIGRVSASEDAPPTDERAPSPTPTSTAIVEPSPLEACAAGDDDVCIVIHDTQPRKTTRELAVLAIRELIDGDWNVPLSQEHRASFEEACWNGDARACAFVAYQTRGGLGVPADQDAAIRWFRLACAQGYWFACNDLTMARDSLGEKISLRSFEAGCEKGDAASCYWAAARYQLGMGGEPDEERAHALFVRACDGGYGTACFSLAIRESDPARAKKLMRLGCKGGSPDACAELRRRR